MSKSDPIADFLTVIRNGIMAGKESVDVPASHIIGSMLEIFKKQDYIDNFKLIEDNKQGILRVYLKYILGKSAIKNLKRISRPGNRVYVKHDALPRVLRGRGVAVVSTSKGLLTDEQARQEKIGGEIICYIW